MGLPVFNGERYLEPAIRSILGQTVDDLELVISDNASTDGTREICRGFASDPRVRYFRNDKNIGGAANFNRVYELSRGHFFKWHGHDDLLGEQYLERCLALLDADPTVAVASSAIVHIDESGDVLRRQARADLSIHADNIVDRVAQLITFETSDTDIFWCAVFGLIRREALARTRLIQPFNAADQVLIFELLLQGKFAQADAELYLHREHGNASMTANQTEHQRLQWFDPAARKRVILTHWRLLGEHLAAARRHKPGVRNELRISAQIARRFLWKEWRNLPGDLKLGARDLLTRQT